ncbi:MAG TPA: prepilin peptidase [Gemmataceae bacterium]|jgi:leader peptidase (prepilin peptidase)/N-methyltransferase|nr:prepilin peptidase [Gemmataceae bacterium]
MESPLPEIIWVTCAFLLGISMGSFLNVVVGRLPLEKSLLWPNSRCLTCLNALALTDNLPILGWLRRRGHCRFCNTRFSSRYMWVELATGLGFALIFVLDVIVNWHGIAFFGNNNQLRAQGVPTWQGLVLFLHHAILFSFLLAASLCDWDHKAIPISLTTFGTMVGLILATCFPWPFPNSSESIAAFQKPVVGNGGVRERMWTIDVKPEELPRGLYPWPVWGPMPDWFNDHRWALGLLTGLAGAAAGMILLRAVKFLFEKALAKEAMGLGDADLMMLAGAFVGWQPVIVGFFMGSMAALPLGLAWRLVKKEEHFPFGPGLALGVFATVFLWRWIGPALHPVLFDDFLVLVMAGFVVGGLFLGSLLLRVLGFGAKENVAQSH